VERFNRTLLEEWAYARLYHSNDERCRAFARWLRFYNHRRPHTSLDGLTPMAVLVNNVHGKRS
jgi:transposase InsO family protein